MGESAELVAADNALVERASNGDADAFEALVARYQDRVYNIALRMVRRPEEAEDVTQETFLKVYRSLPSFGGRSAFYTWIFRIAVNASLSRLRSIGRRREREIPAHVGGDAEEAGTVLEPTAREEGPVEVLQCEESTRRVQEAIDSLGPEDRAAVILRDSEGLSYDEIARALSTTRAAIKSRLHRARAELASKLKDLLR
jgi:RNA polymerase sigma-70 factor (ECF subfamily)